MSNNNYDFKLKANGSSYNLLEMMLGHQKFGLLDHLRVFWISTKNLFNRASHDERAEKKVYDTVVKITKAASQCLSFCQQVLPDRPSTLQVQEVMKMDKLEGKTKKIKEHFIGLKKQNNYLQSTSLPTITQDKILVDFAQGFSKEDSLDFSDEEKRGIIGESQKKTNEILAKMQTTSQ